MGRHKKKENIPVFSLPVIPGDQMGQLQGLYNGVPGIVNGWYGCARCQLSQHRRGPDVVFADGDPSAKVMIIGEAPGEEEESGGVPFVGASGRLMNQILAQTSADPQIIEISKWYRRAPRTNQTTHAFHEAIMEWRRREFFFTNIVSCRPPGDRQTNRPPTQIEIDACWERLHQMIYIVDPWIIIASGKTALEGLLKKKTGIEKVRGQIFDMRLQGRLGEVTYPVMATFHPSYLLRKADWDQENGDFAKTVQDMRSALKVADFLREQHFGTPIPDRGS